MVHLEDLPRGASVRGILPDGVVAVVDVKRHGLSRATSDRLVSGIVATFCVLLMLCVTAPSIAKPSQGAVPSSGQTEGQDECQNTLLSLVGTGFKANQFYDQLGWCYQRRGEQRKAIEAFKKAIRQYPKEQSNYLDLITVLSSDRYLDAALELAKQTVAVFPTSSQAYKMQGLVELMLLMPKNAAASYSRATQLNPDDPVADLGVALAETASGRVVEAQSAFKNGLKRFSGDPDHYVQYARFLLKVSDPGDKATEAHAVQLLRNAVKLNSVLPEPHFLLGKLALRDDNLKEALKELRMAAQLEPDSSKIHFALARTYRRMKREDEATKEDAMFKKLKKEGNY